jgi:glutamyl-tRNA reductase
MPVLVVGLNHRTSPVETRERFAFAEAAIPEALARLKSEGWAQEGVILSTCNRVELYAATVGSAAENLRALREFLVQCARPGALSGNELYEHAEPQSVEHLFRVASGLDSMVLGETEILGQLKKAYDLALQHRHTGAVLNKAFQRAFNVAKHIRTETQIQRGSVSVASVAVELAEKIFDGLSDRVVMVVGAGDTSEKTAKALLSRGARQVLVTNRTFERAEALAAELGGRAVPFDGWHQAFDQFDILISSTKSPHYVVDRAKLEPLMKKRHYRALLLIDIAVPRDIDPAVNYLENVYLYDIDDLQAIAEDSLKQRREELTRCEAIIRERAAALLADPRRHAPVSSGSVMAQVKAG